MDGNLTYEKDGQHLGQNLNTKERKNMYNKKEENVHHQHVVGQYLTEKLL